MEGLFEGSTGSKVRWGVFAVVVLLALFLCVETVRGFMDLRYVGAGVQATNTINVSGYGEAFGAPDIATFTFTVSSTKTTVAAAQAEATSKINAVTDYLKQQGIADKDIRTSDYSINPQYDYSSGVCANGYCPPTRGTLTGYEVRQTTTIKVRDTSKAGDLLTGVGSKGATEVSGLNFTFDDPNKLQNDARANAIADAKQKADLLAKQLGVTLVRVVSYSDSNGGYPTPYYAKDMAYGTGSVANQAVEAPSISIGENKVTSNVNVTYEIR
jgi:uncharacterized protein YggE